MILQLITNIKKKKQLKLHIKIQKSVMFWKSRWLFFGVAPVGDGVSPQLACTVFLPVGTAV